jgi:hypothetical protein
MNIQKTGAMSAPRGAMTAPGRASTPTPQRTATPATRASGVTAGSRFAAPSPAPRPQASTSPKPQVTATGPVVSTARALRAAALSNAAQSQFAEQAKMLPAYRAQTPSVLGPANQVTQPQTFQPLSYQQSMPASGYSGDAATEQPEEYYAADNTTTQDPYDDQLYLARVCEADNAARSGDPQLVAACLLWRAQQAKAGGSVKTPEGEAAVKVGKDDEPKTYTTEIAIGAGVIVLGGLLAFLATRKGPRR